MLTQMDASKSSASKINTEREHNSLNLHKIDISVASKQTKIKDKKQNVFYV